MIHVDFSILRRAFLLSELVFEMNFSEKRIAVIGGGIGGLTFMNAAQYVGLPNVYLYEAAPRFTNVGAGVNITRNANRVLDAIGAGAHMVWKSSRDPSCYKEYRHYRTGEYLGHVEEFGKPYSRLIHRAHLLDALKKNVHDDKMSLNKRLLSLQWIIESKCYVLTFQDETTAEADIIVGCDGIKSIVREELRFVDRPIYSGQMVYRGFIDYNDLSPRTDALLRNTVNIRGPRKHTMTLPIGNEESKTARVGIITFVTEPLENWTSESWMKTTSVDDLYKHVKDWTGAVQEIISGLRKGTPDGNILKQALYVREPTSKWFEVRPDNPGSGVILMGDAVHSTLPHQGQGACQAIESGFALAQTLKSWPIEDDLENAFRFFQDFRKPRTDRITSTSYDAGKMASVDIPEELWASTFSPETVRESMRWIMEYDLVGDLARRLQERASSSTKGVSGGGSDAVNSL